MDVVEWILGFIAIVGIFGFIILAGVHFNQVVRAEEEENERAIQTWLDQYEEFDD